MRGPTDPQARAAWLVSAVAFACFVPSLFAGYVYDDVYLISDNRYVQSFEYFGRVFSTHFWDDVRHGSQGIGLTYYRPLVTSSFLVNWAMGGGSPWVFHLTNVLLHAVTAYLVVRVASRWLDSLPLAVVAGLIFAIHPTRTESVIWIVGRTDIMMALFCLLAVLSARRAAERPDASRLWTAVALGCCVLGIFSKEATALLPLLLVVERSATPAKESRKILGRIVVITTILCAAYVAGRAIFAPVRDSEAAFDVTPRYALMTIGAYVERIVVPWPQTFFYRPLRAVDGAYVYPLLPTLLGAASLLGYLALTARAFRRKAANGWLLLSAAVFIGPVLNFWYTGIYVTTSDHFLYLPLWLFACGALGHAAPVVMRVIHRRVTKLAFGGILVIYAGIDALRVLDYRDDATLWHHELAINPENPAALRFLGRLHAGRGELDVAVEALSRSLTPDAQEFVLLSPDGDDLSAYKEAMALQGLRTADGNVRDLVQLVDAFEALVGRRPERVTGVVGPLELGQSFPPKLLKRVTRGRSRERLLAEMGTLAVRLGQDGKGRTWLSRVSMPSLRLLPNGLNVARAHAQLCEFDRAIVRARALSGALIPPPRAAIEGFVGRAEEAKRTVARASALGEPQRSLVEAQVVAQFGGYLRALRILRPVLESHGDRPEIFQTYVQLLVAARLEDEAVALISQHMPEAQAEPLVASISAQLDPVLRSVPPVRDGGAWWPPPKGFTGCRGGGDERRDEGPGDEGQDLGASPGHER